MIGALRTAVILFIVMLIPVSIGVYLTTSTPSYVQEASNALANDRIAKRYVHPVIVKQGDTVDKNGKVAPTKVISPTVLENDADRASATLLASVPIASSLSAGFVLSWCFVLLIACFIVRFVLNSSSKNRQLTHYQRILISGIVWITITDIALLIGSHFYGNLMDIMLLWNLGVIAVLSLMSVGLSQTGMFRCFKLLHHKRQRVAAAQARAKATRQ